MRRVLVVAYFFPPIGGIGSIRLARFANHLPDAGWEPTVLAPRDTPQPLDLDLEFPEQKVIRSHSIEFSGVGRAVAGGNGERPATRGRGALRDALRVAGHRYLLYPDPQIGWYPGAVIAGLRALRRQRFDVIYSSSGPMTAHLVARTLSRRAQIPWVAEFRDPWSYRLPPQFPYRRRAAALEDAIGSRATGVIAPTPTLVQYYARRWSREIALLPNGHDGRAPSARRPSHATLTHLGTYYPGGQSFRPLWAALAALHRTQPSDVPRIRFIGELPDALRDELAAFGLSHLVEVTGFLPHDEAMRRMASSSMLICSGFARGGSLSGAALPAKLFDYLASGLPILYLGHPTDDSAQLLQGQPGCYIVAPSDVSGAADALQHALEAPGPYQRHLEDSSPPARARALAETLDRAARA